MKTKTTIIVLVCCILAVSLIALILAYEFKSSSYPYWSPDGERISFVSTGTYNLLNTEVWMMDSSGNNKEKLTSFGSIGTHPFNPWSPDGSKLLYMSTSSGSYELWTMDTDGSNKKQLTEGAYIENYLGQRGWDASWSPNGKQVVYVSASSENTKDSDIWIIDSNGSNGTKLTDNGKQN